MKFQLTPLFALVMACGGGGDGIEKRAEHAYIVGSLVFGPEGTTSYVSVIDSLGAQTVDLTDAHEFAGNADVWVHGGSVFVADAETLTITKYSVNGHALEAHEAIGFAGYGVTDFGFWRNVFVADDKAYFSNGTAEMIVWNPTTMAITGSIALPALAARDGLTPFAGYSDRSAVVRGGRLYQPVYWTDETFFSYTPDSQIIVIDIATDAVVEQIEAPCPGLDYASSDAAGNLYFSSWVFAAGAAAVLDQPATCVVKLPGDGGAPTATPFVDFAGGREGAAFRILSDGTAVFSVLHDERVSIGPTTPPGDVTFGANWRFWSYGADPAAAAPITAIDWSAGAQYTFDIDDRSYMLVANGEYSATTVYEIGDGAAPVAVIDGTGWSTRLFKLR